MYHNAQRQKRAHEQDKAIKKVECDEEKDGKGTLKCDNDHGVNTKVK